MSDFKEYWEEWTANDKSISNNTDLKSIVSKLIDRHLIKVEVKENKEGLAEDYMI